VYAYAVSNCGLVNGLPVLEKCTPSLVVDPVQAAIIESSPSWLVSFAPGEQPSKTSDSRWTFFGEAALNKRWSPRLLSTLLYRRTESTASGIGSATLDYVSLVTTWKISELWEAGLRADFTRRESTSPVTQTYTVVRNTTVPGLDPRIAETIPDGDPLTGLTSKEIKNALDTNRWGVGVRMSRRLTKHIRASLRYIYNEQHSKSGTAGNISDFSNHLVTLGVQYDFDRWHLW
jgi:hypothetical protein